MYSDPTFLRAERGQPQWLQLLTSPWNAQTVNFPISYNTTIYSAVRSYFSKSQADWVASSVQLGNLTLSSVIVPGSSVTNKELRILILGQ